MRFRSRLIILFCLLFSTSSAVAFEFFFGPVYWRATESIDWALSNTLNPSDQNITYKTISFNFTPGFRTGFSYEGTWDTKFYYTRFYTEARDSDSGNLTSAFLGGKIVQLNPNFFYRTGQIKFIIDFNMFDWDLGKRFYVTDRVILRPLLGLEGGWIDQTIDSSFQGQISVTENIKNDFTGAGGKAGVEGKFILLHRNNSTFSLVTDFTTSYLWGHWEISDILHDSVPRTIVIHVAKRDFGAVAFQATVGFNYDYKKYSIKLGYEISDWLNQGQIFDDATGPHNNDLIFQGLTLILSYNF